MDTNRSLTPPEVAEILSISKNTVYELIKRGELCAYRIGKKVRIEHADIEEYKRRSREKSHHPQSTSASRSASAMMRSSLFAKNFVICGQDVMLDILSRHLSERIPDIVPLRSFAGSYNGLHELYHERAHLATAHLWDGETDSYNTAYVRRMLPGIPAVIITLAYRMQGFFVQKGNPHNLKSWDDLARTDITIANREKGSGTRILLDEHLRRLGMPSRKLQGYELEIPSHLAVASAISRGAADYGIGNEKTAHQVRGIEFIPLQKERYEMVMRKEDMRRPAFAAVIDIIRSAEFKEEMEGIGGYDLSQIGRISAET